ncbi:MAG: hypothetical protein U9O41_02100 [Candidatus Aerophobetes bacterium]|nr:hypothetical protein [Candidatus Aerophobetes bacterium]
MNGYIAGYGKCEDLTLELESPGLSAVGKEKLRQIVCRETSDYTDF